MTYMKKNLYFCNFKKTHYRPTDGRADRPSYRDVRTHLKTDQLPASILMVYVIFPTALSMMVLFIVVFSSYNIFPIPLSPSMLSSTTPISSACGCCCRCCHLVVIVVVVAALHSWLSSPSPEIDNTVVKL